MKIGETPLVPMMMVIFGNNLTIQNDRKDR